MSYHPGKMLLLITLVLSFQVNAAFIRADTAVASSEYNLSNSGFNGEALNTINGSGMPIGFDQTDVHSAYVSGNHWTTLPSDTQRSITWGFNTATAISGIYIWNHQSSSPGVIAANAGYDVTMFTLTLLDNTNGVVALFEDVSLAADSSLASFFSFGALFSDVTSVRFEITATQEPTTLYTGIAEVGFETAVVNANAPWTLTMVLLSGLAIFYRRRIS